MSESRGNIFRRAPDRKPSDTGGRTTTERGTFTLADRAKGLTRLLALVAGAAAMSMEMAPRGASAGEPTEQRDPKEADAVGTFEAMQRAYDQFDSNDLQQTARTLELYAKNLGAAEHLPPEQRSEFERQYAWLNHRSVVLQYGAQTEYIPSTLVAARDAHKSADEAVLVLSLNLLDQATDTRLRMGARDMAQVEAHVTFTRKVEALRKDIQTTLECVMGNVPEAVAAKQAMIDQVSRLLTAKGYTDFSVEVGNPVADGKVNLSITVRHDGRTIMFNPQITYRYKEKQAEYLRDGGAFGRGQSIDETIQTGIQ
jgi:hypothetical protein